MDSTFLVSGDAENAIESFLRPSGKDGIIRLVPIHPDGLFANRTSRYLPAILTKRDKSKEDMNDTNSKTS